MYSSSSKSSEKSSRDKISLSPTTRKLVAIGLGMFSIVVINAFFYHSRLDDISNDEFAVGRLMELREKGDIKPKEAREIKKLEGLRKKLQKTLHRQPFVQSFVPFGSWFHDDEKVELVQWALSRGFVVHIEDFLETKYADDIHSGLLKGAEAELFYEHETQAEREELEKEPKCGMKPFMTRNHKLHPPKSEWKLFSRHKFHKGLPPSYCAKGTQEHKTGGQSSLFRADVKFI